MTSKSIQYRIFKSIDDTNYAESVIRDLISEMPNHGVEHYFRTKGSMLANSDTVIVAHDENCHVGIMVLSKENVIENKTGLYIRTVLVSERYHGQNLAYEIISHGFKAFYKDYDYFPDFILMTTFNPITYRMMKGFAKGKSTYANVYPSISRENDDHYKVVATLYANKLSPDSEFQANSGVIVNGGGEIPAAFWKNYPTTRDHAILNYFKTHLGERDRFLCIIFCEEKKDKKTVMTNLNIKDSKDATR